MVQMNPGFGNCFYVPISGGIYTIYFWYVDIVYETGPHPAPIRASLYVTPGYR